MATIAEPNVVIDGLVFSLDAANSRCYSGSGFTVNSLVGGIGGTLFNGVGFTSTNQGSFVFDGTNDYGLTSSSVSITNTISVTAWIKQNSLIGNQRYVSWTSAFETCVMRLNNGACQFYISTGGTLKFRSSNFLSSDTWYYFAGTWDGTTQILYQNGIQLTSQNPGGALDGGNLICTLSLSSSETLNGNISQTHLYNRALSQQEILQNYNATKSRYGY
jgi:hypothetical protein